VAFPSSVDAIPSVARAKKQAMEMAEYGKGGKPRSRLSTLPILFGNPSGIPTFPRPRPSVPQADHILDWLYIAMRFKNLQQLAKGITSAADGGKE